MPTPIQIKLLRVIENGEIVRVGSNEPRTVDVRLLSASNRDLAGLVKQGTFREDLFFRLKVVRIVLPPLRERREDIPLLTEHYIRRLAEEHGKAVTGITTEAQAVLGAYDWPGNVRELINTLETMVVLAQGETLGVEDIPAEIRPGEASGAAADLGPGMSLQDAERLLIQRTLEQTEGNRQKTAELLGIGERTLYRKIRQFGLS